VPVGDGWAAASAGMWGRVGVIGTGWRPGPEAVARPGKRTWRGRGERQSSQLARSSSRSGSAPGRPLANLLLLLKLCHGPMHIYAVNYN
jgi:hypothetical protein